MKKILFICLIFCSTGANSTTVYHHNTWESPFSPTYTTVFGSPEIVAPTSPFSSNSLAFNTLGNSPLFYYDQISYRIDPAGLHHGSYNVSFDIFTDSLVGSNNQFTISFTTPTVRNLYFTKDGFIEIKPAIAQQQVLAAYNDNESMHIDMRFDIPNNLWDVSLNGTNIYSGIIDSPTATPSQYLEAIRFSQGLLDSRDTPSHSATVYLDNLLITNTPIPAGFLLFGSGLFVLALKSRLIGIRRRNKPV